MAIVTRKTKPVVFVLARDRKNPEDDQTKIHFRVMSAKLKAFVEEGMVEVDMTGRSRITQAMGTLRGLKYGITKIERLKIKDEDDSIEIVTMDPDVRDKDERKRWFERGMYGLTVLRDDVLDLIDDDKFEIFAALMKANGIDGDEITPGTDLGNSRSSPNAPKGESSGDEKTAGS